ncbi:MAG: hypothetical protein AAGD25_19045 [Cyanobacteria bacterium P01_F01_bin.150]
MNFYSGVCLLGLSSVLGLTVLDYGTGVQAIAPNSSDGRGFETTVPPWSGHNQIAKQEAILKSNIAVTEAIDNLVNIGWSIEVLAIALEATNTIASDDDKTRVLSKIVATIQTLAPQPLPQPSPQTSGLSDASSADLWVSQGSSIHQRLAQQLDTALAQTNSISDPKAQAQVMGAIATAYAQLEQPQRARIVVDHAMAMVGIAHPSAPANSTVLADNPEQASAYIRALSAIATGYGVLGETQNATALIQASRTIANQLADPWNPWPQAHGLMAIAKAQADMGQRQEAIATLRQVGQEFSSEWTITRDAIALTRQIGTEQQIALVLNAIIGNGDGDGVSLDSTVLAHTLTTVAAFDDKALAIDLLDTLLLADDRDSSVKWKLDKPMVETLATMMMDWDDARLALDYLNRLSPAPTDDGDTPLSFRLPLQLDRMEALAPVYGRMEALAPVYGHLDQSSELAELLLDFTESWSLSHGQFLERHAGTTESLSLREFFLYSFKQVDALERVVVIARQHLSPQQSAAIFTTVSEGLDIALADLNGPSAESLDLSLKNRSLSTIASIYVQVGQGQRAADILQGAIAQLDQLEEFQQDEALAEIVSVYIDLDDGVEAPEGFAVLDMVFDANDFGTHDHQLIILSLLGAGYGRLGDQQRMDQLLGESLTQAAHELEPLEQFWVLMKVAGIYHSFDHHAEARAILAQARAIDHQTDPDIPLEPEYQWFFLEKLATAYHQIDQPQKTREVLEMAIALTSSLDVPTLAESPQRPIIVQEPTSWNISPDEESQEPPIPEPLAELPTWTPPEFDTFRLLKEMLKTVDTLNDSSVQQDILLAMVAETPVIANDTNKAQILSQILDRAVSLEVAH